MTRPSYKILISGGGTGGHIFPAIAIADAIRSHNENCEILFVGALGRMEMEKVPQAGYPIKGLWISGFVRSFSLKNLLFPFKLISSLWKAAMIIKDFNPDVVVGVGGYASGPTGKMALRKRVPLLLQEQNSFPGITNKLLARHANKICVAYTGMEKYFPKEKIILTGNPVRRKVIEIEGKRENGCSFFGLDQTKPVVLVLGGSQGARSVNETIDENLAYFPELGSQLIWQTGKLYAERAQKAVSEKIKNEFHADLKVIDFIIQMDLAYAAADIVISRAGAIAISELCAVGKPCILIPLPTAAEDHQTKNAKALAENNAAIHLPDNQSKTKLIGLLSDLLKDQDKQQQLSMNIKKMAIIDAADRIANEILKLANEKYGSE